MLVSFNDNKFKLQKMADRANSPFNEEYLLFISENSAMEKRFQLFGVHMGLNIIATPHIKIPARRSSSEYSKLVASPIRNIPVVAQDIHMKLLRESQFFFFSIAAEELNLGYASLRKLLHKLKWKACKLRPVQPLSEKQTNSRESAKLISTDISHKSIDTN